MTTKEFKNTNKIVNIDTRVSSVAAENSKALVPAKAATAPLVTDVIKTYDAHDSQEDESVEFINEAYAEDTYKCALKIGEYLLKKYYNDDIMLLQSRNPKKHESLRKLLRRKDLKVHPSTLSRMVHVTIQERFLIENRINTDGLNYQHRLEILKLKEEQDKIDMVLRIQNEKLSATDVERLISSTKAKEDPELDKRKLHLSIIKMMLSTTHFRNINFRENKLKKLDSAIRKRLNQELDSAMEALNQSVEKFKKYVNSFDCIECKTTSSSSTTASVVVPQQQG